MRRVLDTDDLDAFESKLAKAALAAQRQQRRPWNPRKGGDGEELRELVRIRGEEENLELRKEVGALAQKRRTFNKRRAWVA